MDECRKQFEIFAKEMFFGIERKGEEYAQFPTQILWGGWQAAWNRRAYDRDAVIEECAMVCEDVEDEWPSVRFQSPPIYCAKRIRAIKSQPADDRLAQMEPVYGDVLPPVGTKVLIHLASCDKWVKHTVVGYYAWADLGGNNHLHRVFVRVRDSDGYLNARLLCDIRPIDAAMQSEAPTSHCGQDAKGGE